MHFLKVSLQNKVSFYNASLLISFFFLLYQPAKLCNDSAIIRIDPLNSVPLFAVCVIIYVKLDPRCQNYIL